MLSDIDIKVRNDRAYKFVKEHGTTLWHYTDFNALDGILRNYELWFGSILNVNDKKEVIGFIDNLKKTVIDALDSNYENKVDVEFQKIFNHLSNEYLYIFCTSKARNDAAQWERYADQGEGVAIVFNTEKLYKLLFYNGFIMNEEYYTLDAKQHKFHEILVNFFQTEKIDNSSDFDGLISNLIMCAMTRKHESFSSEQEIRIAPYFVKENDSHITYKTGKIIRTVYVLNLKELCEKENIDMEDLIDSIVIAPNSKQSIKDLKWYCNKIGLNKIAERIVKSDCPLR